MNSLKRFPVLSLALLVLLLAPMDRAAADFSNVGGIVVYFDGMDSGEADWLAAIDALAIFGGEDFNGLPLTEDTTVMPEILPGTVGYGLSAGPHFFGGGELSMTLNDPGSGGSQTGIINPGENDGSNSLEMRVVADTSDFELFPGFPLLGEGITSADFAFTDPVLGFGGEFHSTTTNAGLLIEVSGVAINVHDFYPDDPQQDGDGFIGFIDGSGSLISNFSFLQAGDTFEQFEVDDLQWARGSGVDPVIPEPSTMALLALGSAGLGFARRRRSAR